MFWMRLRIDYLSMYIQLLFHEFLNKAELFHAHAPKCYQMHEITTRYGRKLNQHVRFEHSLFFH